MSESGSSERTEDWDSTEPVTDYESKLVMMRAERGDTIEIDIADEAVVAKRQQTYYGPKLVVEDATEEFEGETYQLVAPGPHMNLLLWRAITNEDGFVERWSLIGETTAELVDAKQYDICACGEPLKSAEHERKAGLKVGEHE